MESCAVDIKSNNIDGLMGIKTVETQDVHFNDIDKRFKSSEATNYLECIKAKKNIEKIISSLNPVDLDEIFALSSNGNAKINWNKDDLFDVLYKNKSSIFVPLGKIEGMGYGYYIMDNKNMIFSNPDNFIHENGLYGLIIKFDNNMLDYEYAYCECNLGLSLDGENCDFNRLDLVSIEDNVENYIFDALNSFNLFN